MADLTWKVTEILYGCSDSSGWVTITPEEGDATINPTVHVDAATSNDDCMTATIVFSASTEETYRLPVVRCFNSEPEPGDCEIPGEDTDLNDYLSVFNVSVGRNITPKDTPCTYTYLKAGYEYITEKYDNVTDIAISWFIANMLSELTPEPSKVTDYFTIAARTWGDVPELTSTTESTIDEEVGIYQARIDSAYVYAEFKNETYYDYRDTITAARRTELDSSLNQTNFNMISTQIPIAYKNYIPLPPSQPYNNGTTPATDESIETYDGKVLSDFNSRYTDLATLDTYEYGYLPLYDKRVQWCYVRTIFNLGDDCDNYFDEYIENCHQLEYRTSDAEKHYDDNKRWRPGNTTIGGTPIVFICDDTEEKKSSPGEVCTKIEREKECDGYDGQIEKYTRGHTSYPSGHACFGYTAALLTILAYGNKTCVVKKNDNTDETMTYSERGELYGLHRNVVKAHWPSDVLIGKVLASSCIGYLLGFKDFEKYFNKVYPQCGGGGGTCNCTAFGRFVFNTSPGDTNLYAGYAPKAGYDDGKTHVIGYYSLNEGTCSLPTGIVPYSHGGDVPENVLAEMWSGVDVWFTDEPQKDESDVDIKIEGHYTHYIVANKIPANNYSDTNIIIHFKPNNGCTDYFTINQS